MCRKKIWDFRYLNSCLKSPKQTLLQLVNEHFRNCCNVLFINNISTGIVLEFKIVITDG